MITTSITKKTCTKCNTTKGTNEFYVRARGYSAWCKECMKEKSRERVMDGRDKVSKMKYEQKNGHTRKTRVKLTDFQNMVRAMYGNMKKRANFSNLEMNISYEDFESMVSEFCKNNYHVITLKKHPFKPSADRINNNLGYSYGNISIVWMIENYCKNTFTDNEVIEFCKRKLRII